VAVVDDDDSVRESLPDLLRELGFVVHAFSSAEGFLASEFLDDIECLILDVAMPGMSGPALQQELLRRRRSIPIVFITAHADENIWAQVLEAGAVVFFLTPFTETALLDAVMKGLRNP